MLMVGFKDVCLIEGSGYIINLTLNFTFLFESVVFIYLFIYYYFGITVVLNLIILLSRVEPTAD